MAYVADLHIHSRFAYATSKDLDIPTLVHWAKIKGIDLLGTGDCLHPEWRAEFKKMLRDQGDGLFIYDGIRFVLSTEVSCIYNDGGKQRRIHILMYFPNLDVVEKFVAELEARHVNLKADGRPIMGLSVQELCRLAFQTSPRIMIIPAHAWTPWFGMYGSKSGYDFWKQCFGEFSDKIYAIETGLSSDPTMNWRVAELDGKSIVSFSDAHSAPNLGRELTIFRGNLSYDELVEDIKTGNIAGTVEFFPEEGKYHYSGHRLCGIVYDSEQLRQSGQICPVCHKALTIGVMERVEELATRPEDAPDLGKGRPPFQKLVGLEKIIGDALGVGPKTKKVQNEYHKLTSQLGNELFILTKASEKAISSFAGPKVAEGVMRVRNGDLTIEPGFDNSYGKITIFDK